MGVRLGLGSTQVAAAAQVAHFSEVLSAHNDAALVQGHLVVVVCRVVLAVRGSERAVRHVVHLWKEWEGGRSNSGAPEKDSARSRASLLACGLFFPQIWGTGFRAGMVGRALPSSTPLKNLFAASPHAVA